MLHNIPSELRERAQWVCAGPDKVPLSPRTGQPASVIDPRTWGSYAEAVKAGMTHIGFVLAEFDPYAIIDLDNKPEKPLTAEQWARHQKILEAFETYTERSASGRGYHLIVRGSVPSGVHRDSVEVYSSQRYMVCTGDVVRNAPIADCQALLDILYGEMRPPDTVALEERQAILSDEDLFEMACSAANGDKFSQLCRGEWEAMGYPSQSEADFALLSMFAYYSLNNEQVRRLFRYSALGKREKAVKNDRYLNFALEKIRAQQPAAVDFSKLLVQPLTPPSPSAPAISEPSKPSTAKQGHEPPPLPPGLVGDLAEYIYQTAVRPVPEIALAAAIALTAGIVGRSYNISGSGLNQYLILLAKTGSGKEGAATGIDNLIAAIRPQVPMVDQFIGPSTFASGQALIKVLDERPCFVSVLGEFGLTLQEMCSPNANSAQVMLKRVMLDLYSKSGHHKLLRSSVYSDVQKNTKIVQSPNMTVLGESTPEAFYDGLSQTHISEGLIPRFSILEYHGERPPRNPNVGQPPNADLVRRLVELTTIALTTANNHTCGVIAVEPKALSLLDAFDRKADSEINRSEDSINAQLWNRAHLKALKLSGLLAVGCNPHNPVVTTDIAEWCVAFVEREVNGVLTRFKDGEVGHGDHRQEADIRRAVVAYLRMNEQQRSVYKVSKQIIDKQVIPFTYLRRRLRLVASFKNDRRGSAKAIEEALKDVVRAGVLEQVNPIQVRQLGLVAELYVTGPDW